MTIQELAEDAQDFMDYYVLGGDSPRAKLAFVCVVQYPPGRFPDLARAGSTNEVRLPTNVFTAIAGECFSKLEDCVQFEPGGGFPVGYSITVASLKEFDETDG
jgi:hypothetical protein